MKWFIIFLVGVCLPAFASEPLVFNQATIKLLDQVYVNQNTRWTVEKTKQRLLENQFLLAEAKRLKPELISRQSNVGFSNQVHVRELLYALVRTQQDITLSLPVFKKPSHDQLTIMLAPAMSMTPANTYTQTQVNRLSKVKFDSYVAKPLNLAELLTEQSLQNRFRLHQGDTQLLATLLTQHFEFVHFTQQAKKQLHDKGVEFEQLQQIALAELLRSPMLTYFGVQQQMHAERSEFLEQIIANISKHEITEYYRKHKQQFKYISQVYAEAVKFTDANQAHAFFEQAKVSDIGKAIGQDPSINTSQITKGIFTRKTPTNNVLSPWLKQLLFTLDVNSLSKPIRGADNHWYVAKVSEKQFEYFPADSETVIYQAKLAIAQSKAHKGYQTKLANWLEKAKG